MITNSIMRFLLLFVSSASLAMAEDANIYTSQVVPLLTTHCYECHGPKKAKHDLRLDSLEGILKGGKELGPAIIVGKPEESPMIKLIKLPKGEDDSMPPKGPRLTEAEIVILSKWIADGAKAK
jgi:mono/diheme cytochrome c family protein